MLARAESLGEGKRGRGLGALLLVSVMGEKKKKKERLLLKSSWAEGIDL